MRPRRLFIVYPVCPCSRLLPSALALNRDLFNVLRVDHEEIQLWMEADDVIVVAGTPEQLGNMLAATRAG